MIELNKISYQVIGFAYKVHRELGPGLLESAYESCLFYELGINGIYTERQKEIPLIYQQVRMDCAYRIDLMVEGKLIVEIKSVDAVAPIHTAQLMTYLKLSNCKLGLLINFNSQNLRKGIQRIII